MLEVVGQQYCVRLHGTFNQVDNIESIKRCVNGRNIVGQQLPTLLDVTCCVRLHTLLYVVAQSLKPVKLFSQQLPTLLLFYDRRSVAQQCWIRLHGSSDIVGATHAHSAWITKTYGLYSSHGALQVPNLLHPFAHHCQHVRNNSQHCWRKNVGSCCARLHAALKHNCELSLWNFLRLLSQKTAIKSKFVDRCRPKIFRATIK